MTTPTTASATSARAFSAPVEPGPPVSIVIPAYNAAATLPETLQSVQAQTHSEWEAIVVDDGSADETQAIAEAAAAGDRRIRVLPVPHGGVSRARNAGIGATRYDWIIFLDADDWMLPGALDLLTAEIRRDSALELVYGGWISTAPHGEEVESHYEARSPAELFATCARSCPFPMHACLVRKSAVLQVGAFDPRLVTCEDWDLWQRLGRAGVRCTGIEPFVARYRSRPGSATFNVRQVLKDGLEVIRTAHRPDPRVATPERGMAPGVDPAGLGAAKWCFVAWVAGLALSKGEDPVDLVESCNEAEPGLEPAPFAKALVRGGSLPLRRVSAWADVWFREIARVRAFLAAVEERAHAQGFSGAVNRALERLTLLESDEVRPHVLGGTYAVTIDVGAGIADVICPTEAEVLLCEVQLDGTRMGFLELPVCDGAVAAEVLVDAAADRFAWPVLEQFFGSSLFPQLRVQRESGGFHVWRDAVRFPKPIPLAEAEPSSVRAVHQAAGWGLFLQELWGRPDWPNPRFYEPSSAPDGTASIRQVEGPVVLELSDEMTGLEADASWLDVAVTIGGAGTGVIRVPTRNGRVQAQDLRRLITSELGYELCVVAVREALLGRWREEGSTLRERLRRQARRGKLSGSPRPVLPEAVAGAATVLEGVLSRGQRVLVLGRRRGAAGTSSCRRASFPASAVEELDAMARGAQEPVTIVGSGTAAPAAAVYAPDLIWPARNGSDDVAEMADRGPARGTSRGGDRHYFEALFARGPDPWRYTSPYEQRKYEHTLALLPREDLGRVLELACAEGHFTRQLAPHVGRVIAADISAVALQRAAERCAEHENIDFRRLDLLCDPLPGPVDLIVCSEVLYYVPNAVALARVARSFASALRDGGYLLMAHAHTVADSGTTGFDWNVPFGAEHIGTVIANEGSFALVRELRTALYRVQLFRRQLAGENPLTPLMETAEHGALPPEVASQVRWGGGRPISVEPSPTTTTRLPILAYHRVSPYGRERSLAFRLKPRVFEDHLRYLQDAGFRAISLETWRRACVSRTSIPGRAVILTFDDGYVDFAEYAWPLLQKYGFSTTLFVVTEHVGGWNQWDTTIGEDVPLLGWNDLRALQAEGVDIGSHSATHRSMVGLAPEDIVREAATSRLVLLKKLGRDVSTFAYPFGLSTRPVEHLIGAAGYVFGLTCANRPASPHDSLLALPRLPIPGSENLLRFIQRLPT